MKRFAGFTIILLCAFIYFSACGQRKEHYDPAKTYSSAELNNDLRLLRVTMERIHPGLYEYTGRARFDRIFDSVSKSLHDGMTALEFRTALIPIISAAKCDHTWFDTDEGYQQYLDKQMHYAPFRLKAIDSALYIEENYSADAGILKGMEIKEINGFSSKAIISKLLHTESADGNNQTKLWFALGHDFKDKYADFYGDAPVVKLKLSYGGKEEYKTIYGLTADSLKYYRKLRYQAVMPKALAFSLDSFPQAAYLRIRSFGEGPLAKNGQNAEKYFDSVFTVLNKKYMKNLIIDLRGNEGGESKYAMALYAHLAPKPFVYNKLIVSNIIRPFPEMKYTTAETDYFRDSANFKPLPDGRYYRTNHPLLEEHQPDKINYAGNVYVLTDGGTMSASSSLCAVMHSAKRAVFIGEECGGGYYVCNGNVCKLVMPETKVAIGIPMRKFYASVSGYPYHDRGLIPDHEIKLTAIDLQENRDEVMEEVMRLITN